ncbi:hypothetical protein [Amycolatopsis sp. NPDC003731]
MAGYRPALGRSAQDASERISFHRTETRQERGWTDMTVERIEEEGLVKEWHANQI